jgi:hypothetical protein
MPPQNDDEFEPDEEEDLSEAETKEGWKEFDIQSFNSYMLWMKRSDRQLYDDIKSKYGW